MFFFVVCINVMTGINGSDNSRDKFGKACKAYHVCICQVKDLVNNDGGYHA